MCESTQSFTSYATRSERVAALSECTVGVAYLITMIIIFIETRLQDTNGKIIEYRWHG